MDNDTKKKIFIGNVSYDSTIETLTEAFSKFGEIVDSYKPEGKGFAFITFKEEESAQKAMEEMNEKEIDGRKIFVKPARPRKDRGDRSFDR
jgi:RNA recognition motif-containing protein